MVYPPVPVKNPVLPWNTEISAVPVTAPYLGRIGRMGFLQIVLTILRPLLRSHTALVAENLALRQQLIVLQRSVKARARIRRRDRIFWVWLSRLWMDWPAHLVIVQPETVVRWHRQGFKLYWRWKSKAKEPGRPKIELEIRRLIRRMSRENPTWGRRRIASELHFLGYEVGELTVAKYKDRGAKPPSPSWRTFLNNHLGEIAAIDFFTVATVNFNILYCLLILKHQRRRVVHFNVTANPTAQWTAQQVVEAFPFEEAPKYLVRDRDAIFGQHFRQRVPQMNIEEVLIAYRSPWQTPYVERVIGSIRRECLDHIIVLNKSHLLRVLHGYLAYYHESRPHQALGGEAPHPRSVEPPSHGRIVAEPQVGGLHHRYRRAA